MKLLERGEYLLRHARQVLPYLTAVKLGNLLLNVIELQLNVSRPRSWPPYLKVEPTPLCQLACPGCAHGTSDLKRQLTNQMHLGLEDFKRMLDPIADTLLGVSLSLRGEPLLSKNLISLIEYAHSKGIAVTFPTNLSLNLRDNQILRLIRSGVDSIFVSLDGASDDTYRKYRVGGSYELVLRNVKALAAVKKQFRMRRPRIIWKFVIFDHNRHEVPIVKNTYRDLGFDAYEFVEDYGSDDARLARRKRSAALTRTRSGCFWAWHTIVVRADGHVQPCCLGHDEFGLGNAKREDIRTIWRGERYSTLRNGFRSMQASEMNAICARCLEIDEQAIRVPEG